MTKSFPHPFPHRHLLDIAPLSADDINCILDRSLFFKKTLLDHTVPRTLEHKIILTLFVENSTRTRNSFEMAVLRLGGSLMNWDEKISSATKGESFSDTIRYLASYNPDAIIMRHNEYNAPHFVSGILKCPVINAGDSWREHPTQALLDALTMREHKGHLEGLRVAIVGDVAHSRVANSNMALLHTMGAQVNVIAPTSLQPTKITPNVTVYDNLHEGLKNCDVVMPLRIQKERMESTDIPDDIAYFHAFGLTQNTLAYAKADAIVMHPGPMNRGVEIADDVADDPRRSVIFQQGANGVPVRMAVLDLLLGCSV